MDTIFTIIILAIPVIYLGAMIYLVYRLIKYLLSKYGKLTDRLNKRLQRSFFFFSCFTSALLICWFLFYSRTPSEELIETKLKIELPQHFTVLKDQYNDERIWPDYEIKCDILLDREGTQEIIHQLERSKFFNSAIKPEALVYDSLYIRSGDKKSICYRTKRGYIMKEQDKNIYYSLELDTVTNLLKYEEFCT